MKKSFFALLILVVSSNCIHAQSSYPTPSGLTSETISSIAGSMKKDTPSVTPPTKVSRIAEFPGGKGAFQQYLKENIKYSQVSRENAYEGTVVIKFTVFPDGSIGNYEVVSSVNEVLDQAALDVINKMPNWKPALQMGNPIKNKVHVQVNFSLK